MPSKYVVLTPLFILVLAPMPTAKADWWTTLRQVDAERAAGLIQPGELVVSYCPTCGLHPGGTFSVMRVDAVQVVKRHPTLDESEIVLTRATFFASQVEAGATSGADVELKLVNAQCFTKTQNKETMLNDTGTNQEAISRNYHFRQKSATTSWNAWGTYVVSEYPEDALEVRYPDAPDPATITLNREDSGKIERCLKEYDSAKCPTRFTKGGTVIGKAVDLRESPGTKGKLLRTLNHGTRISLIGTGKDCVTISGKTGRWVKVKIADEAAATEGWIFDAHVQY